MLAALNSELIRAYVETVIVPSKPDRKTLAKIASSYMCQQVLMLAYGTDMPTYRLESIQIPWEVSRSSLRSVEEESATRKDARYHHCFSRLQERASLQDWRKWGLLRAFCKFV